MLSIRSCASSAVLLVLGIVVPSLAAAEPAKKPRDDKAVVADIDRFIQQGWADARYKPSPPATSAEWCRRVYLDLLGRIPRVEELQAFEQAPAETRKKQLLDRVFDKTSPEYEELSFHFASIWTNLLIGRRGGTDLQRPVNRIALQRHLWSDFLRGKPYNIMVGGLISADGTNTPGQPGFNGAVNFILAHLYEGEEHQLVITDKVSRVFLGRRVGCTQCHNHPFNDWKQIAFWEMNAFFKQTVMVRSFEDGKISRVQLTDMDVVDPEKNFSIAGARSFGRRRPYPTFLDGTEIPRSGLVKDVNRRDELAKLMAKSPWVAEAAVNRMWEHFLTQGFTPPVDDMGPHNPPSHPELLKRLTEDFMAHDYDLRKLMRWIVMSQAYSLSSKRYDFNLEDEGKAILRCSRTSTRVQCRRNNSMSRFTR